MIAYFISGFGADRRMFKRLVLPDGVRAKYIDWIEPQATESLVGYCHRLLAQVDDRSEEIVFIGLSFGGIVAIELSRLVPAKGVIIISSVATRQELPGSYRLYGRLRLYKLIPVSLAKKMKLFSYWHFGAKTREEKYLTSHYLDTITNNYFMWALGAMLNWKNRERPANLFHIHGTSDNVFPYKRTAADALIKGGEHFMVHTLAEKISPVIREAIARFNKQRQ